MEYPRYYDDQIFSTVGHGDMGNEFLTEAHDTFHMVRALQSSLPFKSDTMPNGIKVIDVGGDDYFLFNAFAIKSIAGEFNIKATYFMHKTFYLRMVFYTVDSNGDETEKYVHPNITLGAGATSLDEYIDLVPHGIFPGNTYEVYVMGKFDDNSNNPGSDYLEIDYVGESFETPLVYPNLASFADGTAPSTAEWLDLQETFRLLSESAKGQNPSYVGFGNNFTDRDESIVEAVLTHRNSTLMYDVIMDSGAWSTFRERTHRISFYVNGSSTPMFSFGYTALLGEHNPTQTDIYLKDGRSFFEGGVVLLNEKESVLLGPKSSYNDTTYHEPEAVRFRNCTRAYLPDSAPAEQHGNGQPVRHYPPPTEEGEPYEPEPFFEDERYVKYRGYFPITGVNVGDKYRISVTSYKHEHGSQSQSVQTFIRAIFERNEVADPDDWWVTLPDFEANTPVSGMDKVRDNAVALTTRLVYENRGAPRWFAPSEWNFGHPGIFVATRSWMPWAWINHRYPFLHFRATKPYKYTWKDKSYSVDSPSPRIIYYYNGWQEVGLGSPDDKDKPPWQVYDLRSVPGLWTSKEYQVLDCAYAFEHAEI